MANFNLKIRTGNAMMLDGLDVKRALENVAERLEWDCGPTNLDELGEKHGLIFDDNGQQVGSWGISVPADSSDEATTIREAISLALISDDRIDATNALGILRKLVAAAEKATGAHGIDNPINQEDALAVADELLFQILK